MGPWIVTVDAPFLSLPLFDFHLFGRHFINDEICFVNSEIIFWSAFVAIQVGAKGYQTVQNSTQKESEKKKATLVPA